MRKVHFETVDDMRVRNGKITDYWGVANLLSLMQQLGGTLSAVRIERPTVVVGSRSGLGPSSRRVALWLLPSSERISAAVRA